MLDPAAVTYASARHRAFGAALRRARRQAGLTQHQFADRVGYSRAQIASIELGRRAPPDMRINGLFTQSLTTLLTDGQLSELVQLAQSASKEAQPIGRKLHGTPPNILFGREADLQQITDLLTGANGDVQRMVTVFGPGGIGKTRLILEIAAALQNTFDTAVVRLDTISNPKHVNASIAQALDLPGRSSSVEHIVDFINQRNMLLVLDNCEHVLVSCSRITDTLLSRCPDLRVLATSRERLGTSIERTHALQPLPQIAARRLFAERARLAGDATAADAAASSAVDEICALLGGIPLAIEIAAAQLSGLSLAQLAGKLHDRFLLEMPGRRGSAPRHASLRKLVDWSYEKLDETDAAILRQLSVFAGSASLEAVEDVIKGMAPSSVSGDPTIAVLGLVAKSLVATVDVAGERRFTLLESVRAYSDEKLQTAGEAFATRSALLAHLAARAEFLETERAELGKHEQFIRQLALELDNIRAMLDWRRQLGLSAPLQIDRNARVLVESTFWYWYGRGHWQEGADLLMDITLASPHATAQELATAQIRVADLLAVLGRYAEAEIHLRNGMEQLQPGPGASRTIGTILASWFERNPTVAMGTLEDSLKLLPPEIYPWEHSLILLTLGSRASREREFARAESALHSALEIAQAKTPARGNVYALLIYLSEVAVIMNDLAKADQHLGKALQLEPEWRSNDLLPSELWLRGVIAIQCHDADRAADVVEEWHALFQSVGRGSRIELALLIAANLALWDNDVAASAQLHLAALAAQSHQTAYTPSMLAAYDTVVAALPTPPTSFRPLALKEACDLALTWI